MSITTLPLSYCGNVHPATSVSDLIKNLETATASVAEQTGQQIAAGLWLADSVSAELEADRTLLDQLKATLARHHLVCYTLNAFPFGNFHTDRVKEQVYLPDWTERSRYDYTIRCAKLLAELLPAGVEGSISTVPLGFKELATADDFLERCQSQLIELAAALDELHDETGQVVRIAIEPEPLCVLETTAETIEFFQSLRQRAEQAGAGAGAAVATHLGVCYDVCHQAVEYEDVAASIGELQAADIRINKVHITCAIELANPRDNIAGREFLAQFAEPRYLHQTFRRAGNGVVTIADLSPEFAVNPPGDWLDADSWRIHFHVPVQADSLGPLQTTRPDLLVALKAVQTLDYAPHLEVETYTWSVRPEQMTDLTQTPDVCTGLSRELISTYDLLAELQGGR